jgi:quercetin dioxygenase-like cupin family protein
MNKRFLFRLLAGGGLFGLGLMTGLVAQMSSDSPFRVEQKRTDLTGAPNMEVIASLVEIKPGDSSQQHFHHGIEAAYVIQGAKIQPPGKDIGELATGATLLNLRDVKHGNFKVVGDTPLKLFTVHIVDKGQPLYDYSN